MRDDRRLIVVEDDPKANESLATVFAAVFVFVMGIAVIDHALTSAWKSIVSWFG